MNIEQQLRDSLGQAANAVEPDRARMHQRATEQLNRRRIPFAMTPQIAGALAVLAVGAAALPIVAGGRDTPQPQIMAGDGRLETLPDGQADAAIAASGAARGPLLAMLRHNVLSLHVEGLEPRTVHRELPAVRSLAVQSGSTLDQGAALLLFGANVPELHAIVWSGEHSALVSVEHVDVPVEAQLAQGPDGLAVLFNGKDGTYTTLRVDDYGDFVSQGPLDIRVDALMTSAIQLPTLEGHTYQLEQFTDTGGVLLTRSDYTAWLAGDGYVTQLGEPDGHATVDLGRANDGRMVWLTAAGGEDRVTFTLHATDRTSTQQFESFTAQTVAPGDAQISVTGNRLVLLNPWTGQLELRDATNGTTLQIFNDVTFASWAAS